MLRPLEQTKIIFKIILFKGFFIPKLLNNVLASGSLINFDFLLSHTTYFDKSNILQLFVFETVGSLLSVSFYASNNNTITLFYNYTQLKSLNFLFLLSFCYVLLTNYLLKQIHHD